MCKATDNQTCCSLIRGCQLRRRRRPTSRRRASLRAAAAEEIHIGVSIEIARPERVVGPGVEHVVAAKAIIVKCGAALEDDIALEGSEKRNFLDFLRDLGHDRSPVGADRRPGWLA